MATFKVLNLSIDNTFCPGDINTYISKGYTRFLDYATFHSYHAHIPDEANDILNTVLLDVLQKDIKTLERLYLKRNGQNRELDFFILKMIKLNCYSLTSPYRYKSKDQNREDHIDLSRLRLFVEDDDTIDRPGIVLKQMRLIRWVLSGLDLTELERTVYNYYFIEGQAFCDWPGIENKPSLYRIYNYVSAVINEVLYKLGLTDFKSNIKELRYRERSIEIVEQYFKTHKIKIQSEFTN